MAKAKSGLSAVRSFTENLLNAGISFTEGAASYTSDVRDGRGHAEYHLSVINDNSFTLSIQHSGRNVAADFTRDQLISSTLDAVSGYHFVDITAPVTKRFMKFVVTGTLGAAFDVAWYFQPRASGPPTKLGSDGLRRIAVDALVGGISLDEDTDDDSIASGQTLLATINLNQQFDGTNWRRVQARGAVADQAYSLMRTLVDSVVRGDDGTDYPAISARLGSDLRSGVDLTVAKSLLVGAIMCGQDTQTNPTGDTGIPEVRQLSSLNAMTTAQKGLLVGAYNLGLDVSGGVTVPISSEQGSTIGGQTAANLNALYVAAILAGIDTTGTATTRAVEVRDFTASGDVTNTLIGVLTNTRLAAFEPGAVNDWDRVGSIRIADAVSALQTVQARESGYLSSVRGRRFIATSQTAGAELTAQAGFVATTPTLMIRQASGATETVIVRSIEINSQAATPSVIKVVVMIDPDDRLSAGGTSVTPQNPNEGSAAASGITSFLENPTATAADADERILYNGSFVGGDGASLTLEFKDELILSGLGSLLIYVFDAAGATAPTISYNVEWEEHT